MKPFPLTKHGAHTSAQLWVVAQRDTTILGGAVIRIKLLSRDGRRGDRAAVDN